MNMVYISFTIACLGACNSAYVHVRCNVPLQTQPDTQPYLTHEDMNADYPRFGSISDVHLDPAHKEMLMVGLLTYVV